MKKIKHSICILIISLIPCILSSQSSVVTPQQKQNRNRSKQLIERYNKLRSNWALSSIIHDSVIDDVTNEILFDKRYKKSDSEYNEDSIRFLFYNKGMMDYKFETKEILDKDTSAEFNAFLLTDSSPNIRMGYSKYGNKHLLVKTKSYLKYDHGVFVRPLSISVVGDSQGVVTKQKNDSAMFFVKKIVPGKYYYHYLNHIPSSSEPIRNKIQHEAKELKTVQSSKTRSSSGHPDLVLISTHTDMYLIVTNESNEIVAILK